MLVELLCVAQERQQEWVDVQQIAGALVVPVVTLVAVGLGGYLSSRSQARSWQREHAQRWREARSGAYSRFLGAVNQYMAYVEGPYANIESVPHPAHSRPLALFDKDRAPYKEALEATYAEVQLIARNPETASRAADLARAARRVAAARGEYAAGLIPEDHVGPVWDAERAFILAARLELGLSDLDA